MSRILSAVGVVLTTVVLGGCGAIPVDVDGTFDRARGGTLVVGVSEHQPWVVIDEETSEATGIEADLIRSFAGDIDAEVEWRPGPESVLATGIKDGELDIVIGGLTTSSPWSSLMAMTRPYAKVPSAGGQEEQMVMGVRMGENELLSELERHLAREQGEVR
ncbi:transporter substrate-binding domain-containing protein [Corynebacterium comes]|uniref:Bacterial extracellular solute-binding protein, family 3 n=1 Tax=Corynebacterium comes TaxID=2675218 RepID=A0A6B8VKF4_9CORY|nr:transporter substrate-binding domain-containing protein [Corynebacterium comes]QGU03549.1 Bacterial extracellular solute-binding protein, family 3 [Corynebacterium comes]